jgi:alpha-amylase/alpha-mannosidase (GH57 family)
MNSFVSDPPQARNDYIDIILDRSPENIETFFAHHGVRSLFPHEKVQVLKLLEMQRNGMLMYTSCGWFFDDISGIESVQVMRYACRAMQLVREVTGVDLEPEFIALVKKAPGKFPEYPDGALVYRNFVQTATVDLSRVGFHYALSSLIADLPEMVRIKNYTIRNEAYEKTTAGNLKLALGKIFLYSNITWEENTLMFAVLHLGDHNFRGGACEYTDENTYFSMRDELMDGFIKSDIPRMILGLEEHYPCHSYSLWDLFRDGQRTVLYAILDSTFADMESAFRQVYNQFSPLLHAMKEMQIPPPKVLEGPIWYIINRDLEKILSGSDIDTKQLRVLVDEMIQGHFETDTEKINFTASTAFTNLMQLVLKNPDDLFLLEKITVIFTLLSPLSLKYDLWECQNYYFRIGKERAAGMQGRKNTGDAHAIQWIRLFEELGRDLGVKFL